jgi:hypothetical protein
MTRERYQWPIRYLGLVLRRRVQYGMLRAKDGTQRGRASFTELGNR